MGRRRKGNRRKRQKLRMQFHSNSTKQILDDEVDRERYYQEQEKYLEGIVELKNDFLSRTILVGSVLPLDIEKNRDNLKRFMEQQYGPVQKIGIDRKGGGRYPRARVTFNFKKDAEKIFGGTSLLEASKAQTQVKVPCIVVGYRGSITVRPAMVYKGMTNDDLNTSSTIELNTIELSLGHWFPRGKDACNNVPGLDEIARDSVNTWIQENGNTSNVNPIVRIDMDRAVVELDITHCVQGVMANTQTVISFRFKDLTYPIKLCRNAKVLFYRDTSTYFFLFELRHPPRLISTTIDPETGFESNSRLTSIDQLPALGLCLGYRIAVQPVEINRMLNAKAFRKMKSMGLFQCDDDLDLLYHAEDFRTLQEGNKRPQLEKDIASLLSHRFGLTLRSVLDANSCAWFDVISDKVKGRNILSLVKDREDDLAERVLNEMREMHGKTRYPAQMFHALYEADVEADEVPMSVPDFCVRLPRVLITPLRIIVTGFQVEMSNRLVRKFIEKFGFSQEAFIRLSVGDENSDKLFFDDLSNQVETRIKNLVLNGITFGKKKYRFLAYSSSQLKEQSLWMVCPEHGWDVPKMRSSMGDFSMCKTASKYAARMGQCFSTTIDTSFSGTNGNKYGDLITWTKEKFGFSSNSKSDDFKTIRVNDKLPDIISAAGMEHSDGVGIIRKELLESLLNEVPFGPKNKKDVSAIQVRYGGAKGVLVAWDFAKLKNSYCNGYDVCLRPSMVKFKAPYDTLEVVTIARRVPYYLNRNVIMLGQHHGISIRTFQDLQGCHIDSLNRMLSDASFASTFLPCLSGPDTGFMETLQNMLNANIQPQLDPFLYSCLQCIRSHHLMNLRKKARIHVADGAVLMGGIDELGLIPENCIFLQVPKPSYKKSVAGRGRDEYTVVKGAVMVTKHPVMHPGDMRMLTAVDIPALREHKNVVLFSQHGERPEADKMSGSDLDGDQYAITWDRRLFLANPSEPMDYSPAKKSDESRTICDDSLLQHFIDHARNDNLGRISMLWIDHASINRDAGCPECLVLAKLASIAVDFPKSGIPAVIPKELMLNQSVPRAHWRERKGLPSFHCESAVGQLYDQVINETKSKYNPQQECIAVAGRYRDSNGQILHIKKEIFDPLFARRLGWEKDDIDILLLDFAEYQRNLYDSQLLELMNQYKIKSEGEVATGCILKYHKLHKRRRHDISEEVRRQFRSICSSFRLEFFTAVSYLVNGNTRFFSFDDNFVDDVILDEDLEWIEAAATGVPNSASEEMNHKARCWSWRLAAAYYVATYSNSTHDVSSNSVLFSFPWVVAADVMSLFVVMTKR